MGFRFRGVTFPGVGFWSVFADLWLMVEFEGVFLELLLPSSS